MPSAALVPTLTIPHATAKSFGELDCGALDATQAEVSRVTYSGLVVLTIVSTSDNLAATIKFLPPGASGLVTATVTDDGANSGTVRGAMVPFSGTTYLNNGDHFKFPYEIENLNSSGSSNATATFQITAHQGATPTS